MPRLGAIRPLTETLLMSSLRQVLLVYLGSGAASGYDIVKGFQRTYGHLWNATWQQVYRDLNKLHEDGLIEQEVVASGNRPPRKVYRLNEEGQQALARFIAEPAKPPRVNDAFLVKIASAHLFASEPLLAELRARRTHYLNYVADLERYDAFFCGLPDNVQEQVRGAHFSLLRGLQITRGWIEWANEVEVWLLRRTANAEAATATMQLDAEPLMEPLLQKPATRKRKRASPK
jgi:PadR family transcriptional regulator AphA